jgi:uncharacterized membrane protein YkoI
MQLRRTCSYARPLGAGILASLILASVVAVASESGQRDRHDHDRARAALQRSEVLPLAQILGMVSEQVPGDIVEVELESERGAWIYEVKLIAPDGRVLEILVDAATGELLETERED